MFLGEYKQTLAENGALALPNQFLRELTADLVVTRGFDNNLMLFELDRWQLFAEKVLTRPISLVQSRNLRRRLFSSATVVTPDNSNRIRLPSALRAFAAIEQEVVLSAMYDYLEIWNPELWKAVQEEFEGGSDAAVWETLGL